ncbi:MAG TPA: bifunctional L-alanine/L-glutamate racemase [Pseudothermotoga sp.]|nr:bifunctional L-alanine/L-glutamate racemase [Pseudothermotoga sp.]HOK84557.1 bifunctional L-alanine/L-glutamate racemase [Pseudothermotoga sp.]
MDITEILHSHAEEGFSFNPVSVPIYETSIFSFKTFEEFQNSLLNEFEAHLYSRGKNPTAEIVERKVAALEKAEDAKLFASGIAAISAATMAFLKSGDHVICVRDAYGWTNKLFSSYLKRFGVEVTFVDGMTLEDFARNTRTNTRLFFLESPTTFTFRLQDLVSIANFAKEHNIKTVIDNTWATPIFQNPVEFGIDIVVHSASKYIGGHSDVVAGVVIGRKEDIRYIFNTEFMNIGATIGPFEAWLLLRGLRTIHIRMQKHMENTLKVIDYLETVPEVEEIFYPFYPKHPQYELAKKQMRGGSGLFSIKLRVKSLESIVTFTNSLKIFRRAVSWGGYESLVMPYAVTNKDGLTEKNKMVRFHIGLENPDLLINDLQGAFQAMRKAKP